MNFGINSFQKSLLADIVAEDDEETQKNMLHSDFFSTLLFSDHPLQRERGPVL